MADLKGSLRRLFSRKGSKTNKRSVEMLPEMGESEKATNGLRELGMTVSSAEPQKKDSKCSKKSLRSSNAPDVYGMVTQWNMANGQNAGLMRKGSNKKLDPTRTWTSSSARRDESDMSDVMNMSIGSAYPSTSTFRKRSEPSPSLYPMGSWSSSRTARKYSEPSPTGSWYSTSSAKKIGTPVLLHSTADPAQACNGKKSEPNRTEGMAYPTGSGNTLKKQIEQNATYTGSWNTSTLRKQSEPNVAYPTGNWGGNTLMDNREPNALPSHDQSSGSTVRQGSAPSSSLHSIPTADSQNASSGHNFGNVDGSTTWSVRSNNNSTKHSWARPERKISDLGIAKNLQNDHRGNYNPFEGIFTPPEIGTKMENFPPAVTMNNNNIEKSNLSLESLNKEGSVCSINDFSTSACSLEVDEVLSEIEIYLGTLRTKCKAKPTGKKRVTLERKGSIFENVDSRMEDRETKG
jgi:hypothetical protein